MRTTTITSNIIIISRCRLIIILSSGILVGIAQPPAAIIILSSPSFQSHAPPPIAVAANVSSTRQVVISGRIQLKREYCRV